MSVIISQINNANDANLVTSLIKKFTKNVRQMSDEQWEDYILGLMADDAEAEGGTVPRKEIAKIAKRHGIIF